MSTPFEMIGTVEELHRAVARMRKESAVALDTEFVWEKTYYAQLGLVQAALADGTCFLIDAVALPDLAPLGEILADAKIVKILHDAPQDLMILRRATGAMAKNILDTRLAAGFAGLPSTISLGNLLAEVLGIQLAKAHTRADWTARPLAPAVLEYAADDVVHLSELAARLRERARQAGMEPWMDEERMRLDAPEVTEEPRPGEAWRRIRVMPPPPPQALAVLREVAAWREEQARRADLPRRWLMEDRALVEMALRMPRSLAELEEVSGLSPKTVQRRGAELLAAVERGLARPEADWPVAEPVARREAAFQQAVDAVLRSIQSHAAERGLDPALVCSRKDLAGLLQAGEGAAPAHPLRHGWRAEFLRAASIRLSPEPADRQGTGDRIENESKTC
jgi:ribonuclease D